MKISLKNMLIILCTILSVVANGLIVVGVLGLKNIIPGMALASSIVMIVMGALIGAIIISLLVMKFVLRAKYKNLSAEEVNQINSMSDNMDTKMALYVFLNPSLAAKQGFSYGSLKLV